MIIINNIKAFRPEANVATMGFFDGVHLGHSFLIKKMIEQAHAENKKSAIVTFDQHPRIVLQQDFQPKLLTSFDEKISLLSKFDCDYCIVLPFTKTLSQFSAKDFLKEVMKSQINTTSLVVGHDHRFGRYREDSFNQYSAHCAELGIAIKKVEPFSENEKLVSSSAIRKFLNEGDIENANEMLGHRFVLDGTVAEGNKIGRKISFPTANLQMEEPLKILPKNGVYSAVILLDGKEYNGMLNIGYRPTIDDKQSDISVECNIFDFAGDIYGKKLNIFPQKFVREEQKFDSLQQLAEQLEKDRMQILKTL